MKKRLRIALMTFALGLAAVYMWNGMSIAMDYIPVDLPKVISNEVLFIFPAAAVEAALESHEQCKCSVD